jgi:plastocyanin
MVIRLLTVLALTVLVQSALACGDDDDDTGDNRGDDNGSETTTPNRRSEADVAVLIADFAFDPSEFTVPAGEDIVIGLTNEDSGSHTFTVYTDAEFTAMQGTTVHLDAGASDSVFGTFDAGEYFFRCELHPTQMQGSFTAE